MNRSEPCFAVLPCWNEAATVASLVAELRGRVHGVVVVDDGSTDATSAVARDAGALVLRHEARCGKGAALRTGLAEARRHGAAWALLLDGDGQHAVDDVPAMLAATAAESGEAALVVGNRMGDTRAMPLVRRWVNRWMSRQLSKRAGRDLPDTQCGFRLVQLEAWSRLDLTTCHFEVESEMLMAFLARGATVRFVPVRCLASRRPSRIKPVADAFRWWRWWRESGRTWRPVSAVSPAVPLTSHE